MIKKISLTLLVLFSSFLFSAPPHPGGGNGGPGGGAGGVGPGVPSSPIDMYIFILMLIAIIGISFYAIKYKEQLK